MKLEFNMIYYGYSNESQFKYHISILGGVGGLEPCLFCLFREGGPAFGKTCLYNTCTLPKELAEMGDMPDITEMVIILKSLILLNW